MTSPLTQDDVTRLLTEKSAPIRVAVAEKLASTIDSSELTTDERRIAEDIVRTLAQDIAVAVRHALSHSLRRSSRLPRDVAMKLAYDVEEVALPIVADSPVLGEADLIQIVRTGSARKQLVVAGRPDVTEPVAEALVATGGEPAVAMLMENPAAQIGPASFGKALDRFGGSDEVKERMARRNWLPPTITERLVAMVSEQLQHYLVTHHELPAEQATDVVLHARDRVTLNLSNGSTEAELVALTSQMQKKGRLTPRLVWRALSLGDMAFFEAAMAALAKVPIANARQLIHDAGEKGLASLYDKSHLPARLFPAVRTAVDVLREVQFDGGERDHERYRARVISRILTQFDEFPAEDLDYMLAKLGDALTIAA